MDNKRLVKYIFVVLVIIFIVVFLICFLCLHKGSKHKENNKEKITEDTATQIGTIDEVSSKVVEPQSFTVSINSKIYVNNKKALAYIKNDKKNIYNMKVIITDNSSKKIVYESDAIKPNGELKYIKINDIYKGGEHDATAEFLAIDKSSNQVVGSVIVEVQFIVEN